MHYTILSIAVPIPASPLVLQLSDEVLVLLFFLFQRMHHLFQQFGGVSVLHGLLQLNLILLDELFSFCLKSPGPLFQVPQLHGEPGLVRLLLLQLLLQYLNLPVQLCYVDIGLYLYFPMLDAIIAAAE